MGINKAILLGNLGRDPELKYTSSQTPVCTLNIATGERRKDASGNWVDHTEWHRVVTFGRTAENCSQYLKKGRQVFIEGRIQTRKWQDKDGKDRYSTEIVASTVQFVGGARGEGAAASSGMTFGSDEQVSEGRNVVESLPTADAIAASGSEVSFDQDDIPF